MHHKGKFAQSILYVERIRQVDYRKWPMWRCESPAWVLESKTGCGDCCSRCQLRQSVGRSGTELEVGQGGSLHYSCPAWLLIG
jgi:hypothetical protein